jgi:hypothetical protein
MAGEVLKAAGIAFATAYGANAFYAWLGQRGGLAHSVTDIDAGEFYPATFTVLMVALFLS